MGMFARHFRTAVIIRKNFLRMVCDVARAMWVLLILIMIPCANAQEPASISPPELPTEAILRIETGQHNATIHRIDADAANRFVVTASDDKTARVWSLLDGRLLRVLRLPIDRGD